MKDKVAELVSIVSNVDKSDLEYDMDLFEEDILDSLATIMLVENLSKEFDVELDVGFLERSQMSTIYNIVETITSMKG